MIADKQRAMINRRQKISDRDEQQSMGNERQLIIDPSIMGIGVNWKRMETVATAALKQLFSNSFTISARILKPSHILDHGDFWIVLYDKEEKISDLLGVFFEGQSDRRRDVFRISPDLLQEEQLLNGRKNKSTS